MSGSALPHWTTLFEELAELDGADRQFLEKNAREIHLNVGDRVFAPGHKPEAFILLLEGTVRIQQVGASGREIVLYRVNGGESCIMTTACLLSSEEYLAEGVTETPVIAVALSKPHFDALIGRSSRFRALVFSRYSSRMTRLMELVEDVAFQRIDQRLARKLLELAGDTDTLEITHHTLAVELGTAREVVSRQLKSFALQGLTHVSRGRVEIVDRLLLEKMAKQT
ncbi:MAG: CRP/FNR family transcriptional regulator [Gammaproteobacteria bacterium]|jgi:CRP/FNR family transcriptional regulator